MMNQTKNDKQQIIPDATPQVNEIADHIHRILVLLGEDPQREGLIKTPSATPRLYGFSLRGIGRVPMRLSTRPYLSTPVQK